MSPQKSKRPSLNLSGGLPGTDSMLTRIAVVVGGLLVLVIIFAIFKSLLGGGSNLTPYVGIAQDQQAMIHVVTLAGQQPNITAADGNFATTAQLSLRSSRLAITNYLAANKQKVALKVLDQKISASTDNQLTAAAAGGTYDQAFQQIMKSQLTTYMNDLHTVYTHTSGKKGHALLADDYQQARLLMTQLNAAANQQ